MHKIKLLRIDKYVDKKDFDDALCEAIDAPNDIYIFQYGRMYKQYQGIHKDEIK